MGFFDEPIQSEVTSIRPGLLHLLKHHRQGQGNPADLMVLANRYLRLNPEDAEVRKARDRLAVSGRGA